MNEVQLANKIKNIIKSDPKTIPQFSIDIFWKLWFPNRKFTDVDFTRKMLDFSSKYKLGYLVVLNRHKRGIAVRFWDNEEEVKLLSKEKEK